MHHQHDQHALPSPATAAVHLSRRSVLGALVAAPVLLATRTAPAQAAPPRVAAPAIVPFQAWAPSDVPRPTGEGRLAPRRLVIHHTYEPTARRVRDVPATLAELARSHVGRGFSTIGYHYVVDPWGGVHQARGGLADGKGRAPRLQAEGAHVAGSNPGAVGIAFLGDHDARPPTPAALTAATQLVAWLLEGMGRDPSDHVATHSTGGGTARHAGTFNPRVVAGHSSSNVTVCPGVHLAAELPGLRTRARQLLHGEPMTPWPGPDTAPTARPQPAAQPEPAPQPAPAAQPAGRTAPPRAAAQTRAATAPSTEGLLTGPRPTRADVSADRLRTSGLRSLAARLTPGAGGG